MDIETAAEKKISIDQSDRLSRRSTRPFILWKFKFLWNILTQSLCKNKFALPPPDSFEIKNPGLARWLKGFFGRLQNVANVYWRTHQLIKIIFPIAVWMSHRILLCMTWNDIFKTVENSVNLLFCCEPFVFCYEPSLICCKLLLLLWPKWATVEQIHLGNR